ncbi:MAG: hypothetical protein RLY16_2148 [Bacteroidota bacterium]|jgi:MFS superfamily sulfate permease-like transporter
MSTPSMFSKWQQDVPASIVVLLVALPLCLGIALGSGAPLFSGIIAGIVGGIVVGFLSGSPLSVSGPAAGLTVIVAAAILKLPSYEAFLLAVVLAGVFQIVLGYLRAGVIGDFIPNSVIKGMLAAIGLILILKQLPFLAGFEADFEGDESFAQADHENTFTEILHGVKNITPIALIIGVLGIAIMAIWELPFFKKNTVLKLIPAPLIIVLIAALFNQWLLQYYPTYALQQKHLVSLPVANDSKEFFSFFTFPKFKAILYPQVWFSAFTLAIVASLETLLGIEAVDKLDPLKRITPTNRELKAQGVGNVVSGLLGGLPLTSVVVRSSANVTSGALTKLSTILHGALLLTCVVLIPSILNTIPLCALASILIFTGYKLAKVSLFRAFYKKGWDQFLPFVATILAILFTDLLIGICIGIIVGLYFLIRSNFHSAIIMVNDKNHYLLRLRKDVSFLNKPLLKHKLETIPEDAYVILDATRADFIDKDIIEEINDFISASHSRNIKVEVKKSLHKPMHLLFKQH